MAGEGEAPDIFGGTVRQSRGLTQTQHAVGTKMKLAHMHAQGALGMSIWHEFSDPNITKGLVLSLPKRLDRMPMPSSYREHNGALQ